MLPMLTSNRNEQFLISNTDNSDQPGQHWVLIWIPGTNQTKKSIDNSYFFDSYGLDPQSYNTHFASYMLRYSTMFEYNKSCVQALTSNVCGLCCYM